MRRLPLILASSSPRRLELLQQLRVIPEIFPADIDESLLAEENPYDYVQRMAMEKAQKIAKQRLSRTVLGSDTSVVIDGEVLGKPQGEVHAAQMLRKLSGRSHHVLSAVAMIQGDRQRVLVSSTEVLFSELSAEDIANYWHTGEPQGKAGGYAIQGLGAMFIEEITGSYTGVMGLPLFETCELLNEFGYGIYDAKPK